MACKESKAATAAADLTSYLRSVGEEGLLTPDDERRLADAIARCEEDDRPRVIEGNLRLVICSARGYRGRGLRLDDLIGEDHLGHVKATDSPEASTRARLGTYAAYRIKRTIRDVPSETTPTNRLPGRPSRRMTVWPRAEAGLAVGGDPSNGAAVVNNRLEASGRFPRRTCS